MKVAGGDPSVHACAVFFGAESRDGDKLGQTPLGAVQVRAHNKSRTSYTVSSTTPFSDYFLSIERGASGSRFLSFRY